MSRTARTPDQHLRVILDHWKHLRDLIDTATPEPWPPAPDRYLAALDEHDRDEVAASRMSPADWLARLGIGETGEPALVEREPLVLAEAPAPLRLHVVDACRAIEVVLAAVCDEIAADVQRPAISPPRRGWADPVSLDLDLLATRDAADERRWRYNLGDRSAPTAAGWLLARWHDEEGPFAPLHDGHRTRIAEVAREAAHRVERTIGTGRRSVPISDRPCPWCTGLLVMHTSPDDGGDAVTCSTGVECPAPVVLDGDGRRVWAGADALVALADALSASDRRRRRRDQKRAERARSAA